MEPGISSVPFVPPSISAPKMREWVPEHRYRDLHLVNGENPGKWEQSAPKANLNLISFRKHLLVIFKGPVFLNFSHEVIFFKKGKPSNLGSTDIMSSVLVSDQTAWCSRITDKY